jgi:hypothetical protein
MLENETRIACPPGTTPIVVDNRRTFEFLSILTAASPFSLSLPMQTTAQQSELFPAARECGREAVTECPTLLAVP